jgi:hypothetical protein
LLEWVETALAVEAWDATAIATYRWRMSSSVRGRRREESGTDMTVFGRERRRWLLLYRVRDDRPSGNG